MTKIALRRVTAIEAVCALITEDHATLQVAYADLVQALGTIGGPVLRVDIDEREVTTALRPAISKARNDEPKNALRLMKFGEEISPGFVDTIGL